MTIIAVRLLIPSGVAPPEKVSVIAVVEYRGFGYISGSLSSSHGNISISGVSIGEFKKGANGHAVPPNDSAPKNTYAFGTDPTDSPWRTALWKEHVVNIPLVNIHGVGVHDDRGGCADGNQHDLNLLQ